MKNLALLILLVLSISLKAQLSEKFTDGNFNNNPVWFGDTCSFKITSSTAIPSVMRPGLQMYNTIAGNSYIVTSNPLILSDDEWDFWIKLSFNPSENNNAKAYIVSDQSDLKGALNGYYIGIGETNDKITFCKQTGLTSSILCSGINANLDKSNNPIRIHIKRSINALWQIYSDTLGGSNFILEGSVIDNTFSAGTYFGFSCLYTSTDADKFYFDDVYAGEIIVDTIAPKLVLINTPSPNKIDVLFSESVDQITSTDIYNYYVTNGVSYPISVQQDAANKCLVHLNFSQSFATNILYTININNVKDVAGNVMNQAAKAFMYAPVIDNSVFRILINEVMTDENPEPNQLPAVDYIELYNRSADAVNLKGWAIKLKDAGDTLYFDEVTLLPDCYLVLCDDGNVTQLSSFCQNIYSFTSFVVNNETCVTLYNSGGEIEHQLNYDAGWYHNSIKSQGGWSLELIDPANPCGGLENWKASTDIKGGTPGERNAVYGNNPDKLPPKIEKICVIDSNCIKVYFNEQMLKVRLLNTAAYSVEPHLNINNIINDENEMDAIVIKLFDSIKINQIYKLLITDTLQDCVGNILPFNTSCRFANPEAPQTGDIIINEILFNPKPDGVDFVEIYNRSQKNIALNKVYLSGYNTYENTLKYAYPLTNSCDLIYKNEYVVLTTDPLIVKKQYYTQTESNFVIMSSLPSFNNDEGIVILAKIDSTILDRFDYNAAMHFPLLINVEGVSLERINPNKKTQDNSNWHSASKQSGFATPAYQNSQYSDFLYMEEPFTITPEIFSPDNDGFNDVVQISYQFNDPGYTANVLLYDGKGRFVKTLVKNELLGTKGSFIWDGINENNEKANIGIYIAFIEVFDMKGNVKQYKKTIVLGGKL